MSIYVGDKKALLLKSDNSVVEFYKGDKKLFGYDGKAVGAPLSIGDVHPAEHNVGVKVASKNLFDISQDKYSGASYIVEKDSDKITVGYDTKRTYVFAAIPITDDIAGKTVTVSATVATSHTNTAHFRIQWLKNTTTTSSALYSETINTNEPKNVTFTGVVPERPDEESVLCVMFYSNANADNLENGTLYTATYSNIQIEQGTTATACTPYVADFSNITLTRAENIGKYVFTGEEAFYLAGSGFPYGFYAYNYVTDYNRTSNIQIWCTHFECVHNSEIDNENATFTFCQYDVIWYFNYDNQKSGVANFKEWLRQNYKNGTPVTVYYKKVDTTDEDFTDYTANADGTVDGVKSISPNMTLIPNTNAVTVECEYCKA